MGILQPAIPVRRMANERKTKLTDALVRILRRFLTPATATLPGLHDLYLRDNLLALAGHGDGHILTVTVALLLAILTGRSDLCIAGAFRAGKTRSLRVLLIALSCELDDFSAVVYTKENVAAKALADQISDLSPPTLIQFGQLLGRIEEGKARPMQLRLMFDAMIGIESSRLNVILLQLEGLPQWKCPCDTLEALRCKTRLGARFWAQNRVLLQSSKIGTSVSRFQCVCVGVWVCGCGGVGVWGCGCVGVCVCGCVGVWGCGGVGVWGCGGVGVWGVGVWVCGVWGCGCVWVCGCVGVWVCGCVCVCVRACMRACVRGWVCVWTICIDVKLFLVVLVFLHYVCRG